jgi:ADP-heptose:LPS heptosyltransferase
VDWIDEILEYYPREVSLPRSAIAFLRRIRSYRFDVFIELCNDVSLLRTLVRNMLFVRLAGAEWAGGWSINTLRIALQQQSEYIDFPNEVERLVKDVERIGISTVGISYAFPLAAAQERRASAILSSCGLPDEVRMVAIAPGAKRPGSRWPAERFIEVGRRMAGNGYKILLLGTDEEWALAEAIRREIGGTCVNLAGTTDIPTMASILKRCLLLICNDSGPQHVASAVGTPCVAISSFWHLRGKWHAHHPRSVVLQKMVPCHTCFKYDCPNENLCLTEIAASEAAAAALVILDGVSPARAVYASDGERCSASGN